MTTTIELPKYAYRRGNKIWVGYKDITGKWVYKSTPYRIDQVEEATVYIESLLQHATNPSETPGTLRAYVKYWLKEREERQVAAVNDERGRLTKYVLPTLGKFQLSEIKPRHVRDLMRDIRKTTKLAPRTIGHIYSDLHNVFESALIEEEVTSNPVKIPTNELPKRVDKDPEWRMSATYERAEVLALLADPAVPMQRRVLNALKALAGMRHGEAAAVCWRHWDECAQPLTRLHVVQAWCSKSSRIKGLKDETVRQVPVHPALHRILYSWRAQWHEVYGREPTADDHIVPTRTLRPISVVDACEAMKRDFAELELRLEAGKYRDRGGHDLRAWFKTQVIEDGADKVIVRRVTHASPKDVDGGYERFSWEARCREVLKLKFDLPGVTWTPPTPASRPVSMIQTAAQLIERALRAGNTERVLSLTRELWNLDRAQQVP